jgi:hypothetical protein
MKNLSLIAGLTGMVLVMLAACSSEQWRHTSYETLKAAGRQQCLNEAYSDCPRQPEYDEYLQEREQVVQPTNSE